MEQYREGQYDDDLTVGIDEFDEDFDTGAVDLFDYVGDDDSPLSRLKSIILSIDWEITDDILRQFNEELLDLKDIWAGNKVNLIYIQALEKLSRYIYKEKADAHPNTIKLLLTFYANLEKIVSSDELSDHDKKTLLMEDVQRFEKLKKQIGRVAETSPVQTTTEEPVSSDPSPAFSDIPVDEGSEEKDISSPLEPGVIEEEDILLNLKAIVYGIDWEITERDLANLSKEVNLLEKKFQSHKAKLIFLQGIGSLGAYINLKRSNAHADAFKLLHSFFIGLERVVKDDLSGMQEKNILMPEVQKFNVFKASVADTLSPEAMKRDSSSREEPTVDDRDDEIQPAFAEVAEGVHGFREDEELAAIQESEEDILAESTIADFTDDEFFEKPEKSENELAVEMESRLSGMFTDPGVEEISKIDPNLALKGVDVESDADDESEEEPLPQEDGELAPALVSELDDVPQEESPAVFTDQLDDFFTDPDVSENETFGTALPGVDVETEADDDTEEEPLPFKDGEFAPALIDDSDEDMAALDAADTEVKNDEPDDVDEHVDHFFSDASEENAQSDDQAVADSSMDQVEVTESSDKQSVEEVEDRFDDFFGTDDSAPSFEHADGALAGVEVETEADDESDEEPLLFEDGELAPALDDDDESPETKAVASEDEPGFVEEKAVETDKTSDPQLSTTAVSTEQALMGVDVETEEDDESDEEPLPYEDDELAPALSVGGEESVEKEVDSFESLEESENRVAEQFDAFFGTEEEGLEAEDVPDTVLDEKFSAEELDNITDSMESAPQEETAFDGVFEDEIEEIPEQLDEQPVAEVAFEAGDIAATEQEIEEQLSETFPFEDESQTLADVDVEKEAVALASSIDDAQMDEELAPALKDYSDDQLFEEIADLKNIEEIADEDVVAFMDEDEAILVSEEPDDDISSALLDEFNRIAGDEDPLVLTHPHDNEDYIIAVEGLDGVTDREEEVVFKPVDEEEEAVVGIGKPEESTVGLTGQQTDLSDDYDDFDDLETFGTVLLSDEEVIRKTPVQDNAFDAALESVSGELDEDKLPGSLELLPETEFGEWQAAYVEQQVDEPTQDNLSDLRNCIISLGLEINDSIIISFTEEIEKLRHAWMSKPIEKTFLQLLSTVANHIEDYRYEADSETNKLLLSVFDKLEIACMIETDSDNVQETLLAETSKVLQWQQRIINRKLAATQEQNESFIEKVTETTLFEEPALSGVDEPIVGDSGSSTTFESGVGEIARQAGGDVGQDELVNTVSGIMKNELDLLKEAFRQEIQELKKELLGKNRKE